MSNLELQDIYIYPIKSLGGISLLQAEVQKTGLKYDRRWMLADYSGTFVSQRTYANMAMLQVAISDEGLVINHKKNKLSPLTIALNATTNNTLTVSIWEDTCTATEVSLEANEWFSEALQMPVRLVFMPETTRRQVDSNYATTNDIVSFADDFPLMMIGQASLNDLNSRLDQPVLMNRFRPNLVFKGGEPYQEDSMYSFKIGEVSFKGVKPCARCVLTTVNQEEATKGVEPLKTLATYRTIKNKVMFGQNLLQQGTGVIKVGDKIVVD
jgi:uncharacterized protein YcbX